VPEPVFLNVCIVNILLSLIFIEIFLQLNEKVSQKTKLYNFVTVKLVKAYLRF